MKPTMPKCHWLVWTTDDVIGAYMSQSGGSWCWSAHGPRGTESGFEISADAAVYKAQAAAALLSEPKR